MLDALAMARELEHRAVGELRAIRVQREHQAAANRERFPAAAQLLDLIRAGGMGGRITYSENARCERIGERFEDRCKREGLTECRVYFGGCPK